jgi:hypothetical protein
MQVVELVDILVQLIQQGLLVEMVVVVLVALEQIMMLTDLEKMGKQIEAAAAVVEDLMVALTQTLAMVALVLLFFATQTLEPLQ